VLFLSVGLLLFVLLLVVTDRLIDRTAESEALGDARRTTAVLAKAVAERSLTEQLVAGDPGAIDRFDRAVGDGVLVDDVRRIKLWAADGTIVYSDQTELIGERFDLDDDELAILADGGTDAEVSDLTRPENQFESDVSELVEVYTRIETPDGDPLLFEVYFSGEDIAADTEAVLTPFRRIMIGALAALGTLAALMIWALARRLRSAADERQRLLQSAIDASESERRRIARDLHDGVVQDLAGTAFALSAADREPGPPAPDTVSDAAASLRRALRALRSLLVEIHPPDLDADGLGAALQDLVAPAGAAGIDAHVEVMGIGDAPEPVVALVWRVAQEGVRNAIRHSGGSRLDVRVHGDGGAVVLEVVDDGAGIDETAQRRGGHLGLRGLTSLARESGAQLTVTGAPGSGTTLRLEVAR
jgi:two-component system, NarL family, sensor kinase